MSEKEKIPEKKFRYEFPPVFFPVLSLFPSWFFGYCFPGFSGGTKEYSVFEIIHFVFYTFGIIKLPENNFWYFVRSFGIVFGAISGKFVYLC